MSPTLIYLLSELVAALYGLALLGAWLATATLLALASDAFLRVFDFALDEGHLFSPWYEFIQRFETTRPWLFKVLGGCQVCSGFWGGLLLFWAYQWVLAPLPLSGPVLVLHQAVLMGGLVARARKRQREAAKLAMKHG